MALQTARVDMLVDARMAFVPRSGATDAAGIQRVEAATIAGVPVYFQVLHRHESPRNASYEDPDTGIVATLFILIGLTAGSWLALRNLRRGAGEAVLNLHARQPDDHADGAAAATFDRFEMRIHKRVLTLICPTDFLKKVTDFAIDPGVEVELQLTDYN